MPEWFQSLRDDLWLQPDESGEEEASFIKRALGVRKGQRVLDAPCGAGRIAVHLAMAGCDVTGVDIRRAFIARARRRFRNAGVDGRLAVLDLRRIEWSGEFHGICNWGGSFGYFDDEENAELVRRYARALRAGGRLLIDQAHREYILRNFLSEVATEKRVSRNRWNARSQRLDSEYFVNGRHRLGDTSSMRLYTRSQTERLFRSAGLEVEAVYGYWDGAPCTRASRRMIFVGRKP